MTYAVAKARAIKAEVTLKRWSAALNNPKKFQPLMKIEWDRAFDAREAAIQAACKADPHAFVVDFPTWRWLAVYLGLIAPELV